MFIEAVTAKTPTAGIPDWLQRADASDWDLGYPVATQLDDGRISTAYYYMENDGNNFGGTRHITGSFFRP